MYITDNDDLYEYKHIPNIPIIYYLYNIQNNKTTDHNIIIYAITTEK